VGRSLDLDVLRLAIIFIFHCCRFFLHDFLLTLILFPVVESSSVEQQVVALRKLHAAKEVDRRVGVPCPINQMQKFIIFLTVVVILVINSISFLLFLCKLCTFLCIDSCQIELGGSVRVRTFEPGVQEPSVDLR